MSSTIVYSCATGQRRPVATDYELAELAPVRAIRRPTVAKHKPRLTCTPQELARASSALSRKEWNRTLCAQARLVKAVDGRSVYVHLTEGDAWSHVQRQRALGFTPDQVITFALKLAEVTA